MTDLLGTTGEDQRHEAHDWQGYPLIQALRDRRSRRVGLGMEVTGGPTTYRSPHAPLRLTDEEEAILAFAAAGITGPSLNDWDWAKGRGGNIMSGIVGRTASSSDSIQSVAVIVINDEGTWLIRRPLELSAEEVVKVTGLVAAGDFIGAYHELRVQIAPERRHPPVEPPYNLNGNRWSLHVPGSTYFLMVADMTLLHLNVMLEMLNSDSAYFPMDERRMYLAPGVGRFARSKGGHLKDDPTDNLVVPVEYLDRLVSEIVAVEQGMILQNLGLTCQALGLGGFPHYTGHDEVWFEALGFRTGSQPISEYLHLPLGPKLVLKARGKDKRISYPLGLEVDGRTLLKPYAPPYYPTMSAAVDAVVDLKFGPDGLYRGRAGEGAWLDPARVARETDTIEPEAIEATKAFCEYLHGRYGRYPVYVPAFHTLMGFQAVHVDTDFYDTHYRHDVLPDQHRDHLARWHDR